MIFLERKGKKPWTRLVLHL